MQRLFPTRFSIHAFPQEGILFEHTSAKGDRLHSRREIREFAKRNDMEFDFLS